MPSKKHITLFFAVIFIFSLGFASSLLFLPKKADIQKNSVSIEETSKPGQVKSSTTNQPQDVLIDQFLVTRVIDGDTIEIEGGQKIRYIGIDTPETVHPDKPVQCYGRESSDKNKNLVEGKQIRMEKDVSETDRYGRLLRYVFIGDVFVNDYLVKEGFAKSSTFPPDVKYQQQFLDSEKQARDNNLGLWAGCQKISQQANQANLENQNIKCPIKGNISSTGEKIYHMPGQRYYDKTQIDLSRGEQWFCTEEEAISAGFRRSKI